jgi:hypothetical protein
MFHPMLFYVIYPKHLLVVMSYSTLGYLVLLYFKIFMTILIYSTLGCFKLFNLKLFLSRYIRKNWVFVTNQFVTNYNYLSF